MVNVSALKREAETAFAGKAGAALFDELRPRFEELKLPPETVVIINIETGDFVVGTTLIEAITAYRAKWALDKLGYTRRVGGPFRG